MDGLTFKSIDRSAWRKCRQSAKSKPMKPTNLILVTLCGLACLANAAFAQSGSAQRRLQAASRIDCTFSTRVWGEWDGEATSGGVETSEFGAAFFDINTDEGTAEADSRFGASFIIVRYAEGYLHFMQMFRAGPLYVTTVLARETANGKLMAVHTRHEYTPIALPGFTSRPEMYIGDCEVTE
jgi:hypothetical protein